MVLIKVDPPIDGIKHKGRLEVIQIDPNVNLPVEMISAKLREQIRMYEVVQQ